MKYTVFNLDMWGHVSADCCGSYKCSCISESEDGEELHDDNACNCTEECNDKWRCGAIDVQDDADDQALIKALFEEGFLSEKGLKEASIDDYSDGTVFDVVDKQGRKLYELEECHGPE